MSTVSIDVTRSPRRDFEIDLLRAIAILEVILAHTVMPAWLFQVRNFGVPLLLMLSGMSFVEAAKGKSIKTIPYMVKRFRKLVIPTWSVLTLYFAFTLSLDWLEIYPAGYGLREIIESYILLGGIGFVWVIRVNLLVSVLAPIFLRLLRRDLSINLYVLMFMFALSVNEILYVMFVQYFGIEGIFSYVVRNTVFFMISYGAIFFAGMIVAKITTKYMICISSLFAFIFCCYVFYFLAYSGYFVQTQNFKYPPQIYYLSYALSVSFLLIAARKKIASIVVWEKLRGAISFIGGNTLWIYLWHILALRVVEMLIHNNLLPNHFITTWIATATIAIGLTKAMHAAVSYLKRSRPSFKSDAHLVR